jgi:Domain of unknown function (DUF4157)
VEAAAYTIGHDIVFGAGQYAPATSRGRSLLAHELAHVVQPSPGRLSRAPDTDKEKKQKALAHHKKQQRLVVDFLKNALKLARKPKDPLDPDNLYRNTAELIDKPKAGRKIALTILTPTHYSTDARSVYFDWRIQHPKIGGDYVPDPDPTSAKPSAPGLVTEKPETAGRFQLAPSLPPMAATPKKEERTLERVSPSTKPTRTPAPPPTPSPPPAPAPSPPFKWSWAPGDVRLFFNDQVNDVTEAEFKNTFVHEGQHAADLSQRTFDDPKATDSQKVLAHYQSEFRSFWIQPVIPVKREPGVEPVGVPSIENLPAQPADKPANSQHSISGACPCGPPPAAGTPAPAKTSKSVTTALKKRRQEVIFQHLLASYPNFQCFYVCDPAFKTAVDDFAFPVGANLVNSQRLLELNLEMQNLDLAMKPAAVADTGIRKAILDLDAVDWAFLQDKVLSDAFWKDLDLRAPKAIVETLQKSAAAGKVDQVALDKATVP